MITEFGKGTHPNEFRHNCTNTDITENKLNNHKYSPCKIFKVCAKDFNNFLLFILKPIKRNEAMGINHP